MDKFIIAHDMGTSGNKAVLVSVRGEIIDSVKEGYQIYHDGPGSAEQYPLDWWNAVIKTTRQVLEKTGVKPDQVVGVTFSSQVMSLVPIDKKGNPLIPSMTWLDVRSADILAKTLWTVPRVMGYNIFNLLNFLRITGGSPGHTGKDQIAKILWLRENKPDIFNKVYKYLDAKDFVIYKLTGNLVTSADVGYVWWLMDSRNNRNQWHPKLCRLAGVTQDQLAEIKNSADIVGYLTRFAAEALGLPEHLPVINGASDISSAALGSGGIDDGELHIRIGTSGGVAGHFTKRKIDLAHYAGCIGSTLPDKYYLGIAHQETAGLCLEWLKNNVLYHEEQLKQESAVQNIYQLLDKIAESASPGANGLIFTPWMYGERCPLDDNNVRGGFFNINLDHKRDHLVRAVFEGVAFNTRWAMETLEKLYQPVEELRIIGGGAKSEIWCQIVADITNRKINQIENPQEAGAKGVALLASKTLGFIDSYHDIKNYIKIRKQFKPRAENRDLYDGLFAEFKNIYKQNKRWYKRMNKI
jgi:xylulokinase